jgi:hypothetical protein
VEGRGCWVLNPVREEGDGGGVEGRGRQAPDPVRENEGGRWLLPCGTAG